MRDPTDRMVPAPSAPSKIRLVYARATARYWVYERPPQPSLPDTLVVMHLRQRGGRRPDFLIVSVVEGIDQPNVQGGRWIEEEEEDAT